MHNLPLLRDAACDMSTSEASLTFELLELLGQAAEVGVVEGDIVLDLGPVRFVHHEQHLLELLLRRAVLLQWKAARVREGHVRFATQDVRRGSAGSLRKEFSTLEFNTAPWLPMRDFSDNFQVFVSRGETIFFSLKSKGGLFDHSPRCPSGSR